MLTLENVEKQFKGQNVLRGVNLDIPARQMISIMGRSGSGKSTLLGIMAGTIRPDHGRVVFADRDITALDEESLAAFRLRHIGIVFQDFKLIPSLSVADNIYLGIHPRRDVSKAEKRSRALTLAAQVGLVEKISARVDDLSGGEKQRVAIARSLINEPTIVLADEPTGNLDAKTAEEIMDLFGVLQGKGTTTFVIVTHDAEIARRTQKIYTLQDGEIRP